MSTEFDITAEYLRSQSFRVLHAGDDYDYKFSLLKGASPLDLTGAKAWLTIKEASLKTDAEAKLQLSSASVDEIEITDALLGELVVKFRGSGTKDTSDLEGQWRYDLQVKATVNGSLKVMTVAWGLIEFLPNLTRAVS